MKQLIILLGLLASISSHAKTVTDLAGRSVEIPDKVERIILGESRYLPALAILERDNPIARIVGMLPDFKLTDPGSYRLYQQHFPAIDDIPLIGHASKDSFSVESAINLRADVAIFGTGGHGPSAQDGPLIKQLQAAGVAVVFVDFRQQPIKNTPRSLQLMGEVLGREEQAQEFIGFYQQQLARIEEGMARIDTNNPPRVFLHSRVGIAGGCCETMVHGMLGHFIKLLQAKNIAEGLVPGHAGIMNMEYLLVKQPDIYIATAIGSPVTVQEYPQFIALGAGVTPATSQQNFERIVHSGGLGQLSAVQQDRAYAIWHHFYNTPLNIAALQAFAKWIYPQEFSDLDPQKTLQTLYQRFQPIPLDGVYWVGLQP